MQTLDPRTANIEDLSKVFHFKSFVNEYPEELKLSVVTFYVSGYSMEELEKIFGVSTTIIGHWINDPEMLDFAKADVVGNLKKNLARKCYMLANRFLSRIDDSKIDKEGLKGTVISACTLVDKARLIEGASTENIAIMHRKIEDVAKMEDDVDAKIEKYATEIASLKKELAEKLNNMPSDTEDLNKSSNDNKTCEGTTT